MRLCAHFAAVLVLAGTAACQEPPSYRLRWAIDGREMLDATTCAESGLFDVRLRAYSGPGELADERTFPCSATALLDPEGTVGGSALPPGRYAIELRGVDRTGTPWHDEEVEEVESLEPGAPEPTGCVPEGNDPPACRPEELVCDCQRLVVVPADGSVSSGSDEDATVVEEGSNAALPEFVLAPPAQCIDGIDNDRDGLIDVNDPSCNVDFGDGTEAVPVGVTELRLELSLLDDNPAVASCAPVPIRRVQVRYGSGDAAEVVLEDVCQLERPYLASLRLPAGTAELSVVGLDPGGTPVTVVKTFEAEISSFGGTVQLAIDFGPDDFLEPVVQRIYVDPAYVSELGRYAKVRYSCEPPIAVPPDPNAGTPAIPRGLLAIDRLRVSLLNGHGGALDSPATLQDGTVLDGPTEIPCTLDLVTAPLEWGSFTMELEALSVAGEVCFSNKGMPVLAGPGGFQSIFMPRVYEDGKVPESCHDCEVDADCGFEDALFCVDNVCQSRCSSDDECLSDELGDLGFSCLDGVCRQG